MSAQDFSALQFRANEADATAVSYRPWPRYFTRMLDLVILSMPLFFVLVMAGMFVAPASTSRFVDLVNTGWGSRLFGGPIAALLTVIPIGLLLAYGQTPGKWLFGIRVRKGDGSRLSWRTALHREALVITHGLAFGVPLVNCFTLYNSMSRLNDTGRTSWDERLGCEVTHAPATPWWWTRAWFGGLVWAGLGLYDRIIAAIG